jgi:hypothetical protein
LIDGCPIPRCRRREVEEGVVVLIDCDSCTVRGLACGDCVITVLLGVPPVGVELDAADQAAISALAYQGLVPPLRLVTSRGQRDQDRSAAS